MMKVQHTKRLQQIKESLKQHKTITHVGKIASIRIGELERGLRRE